MTDRSEISDIERRAEARVGAWLKKKYRLHAVLGIGGMATVYRATHRNTAEFAVKVLHAELSVNADIRARFLREGYTSNSVKHPGAVRVVDDDVTEDGAAFLVMELLEGSSVESLWARANMRLPVAPVIGIGRELLDVMAVAHEKGIVHRDLKPANLFVTRAGVLKVLDFGIASVRDVRNGANLSGSLMGMPLGTPAFMPPEQALAQTKEIDARSDIWAIGATLFTLLAGRTVHRGDSSAALIVSTATRHAPPLRNVAPEVPPELAEVIDRALRFQKSERWSSAREMRDALDAAHRTIFGTDAERLSLGSIDARQNISFAPTEIASNPTLSGTMTIPKEKKRPLLQRSRSIAILAAAALAVVGGVSALGSIRHENESSLALASTNLVAGGTALVAPSATIVDRADRSDRVQATSDALANVSVSPPPQSAPTPHSIAFAAPRPPRGSTHVSHEKPLQIESPNAAPRIGSEGAYSNTDPLAVAVLQQAVSDEQKSTAKIQPIAIPAQAIYASPPADGYLDIATIPSATVMERSRVICDATPCTHVALPPGTHHLTLWNATRGIQKRVDVEIKRDRSTSIRVPLDPMPKLE